MELDEVLRRRRMVRCYSDEPVSPAAVDALVAAGLRAPSAGFTQGFRLLIVADAADRQRLWEATDWEPPDPQRDRMSEEMRAAPLVIVPLCSESAYRDRYSEPDKAWIPDDDIWSIPYWYVDAGFAALLVLLKAVDLGLGALFMGATPRFVPRFKEAFGVPDDFEPIGLVLVGHRHPDVGPAYRTDRRRPVEEMVHWGRWGGGGESSDGGGDSTPEP
jgi:nitroreductase